MKGLLLVQLLSEPFVKQSRLNSQHICNGLILKYKLMNLPGCQDNDRVRSYEITLKVDIAIQISTHNNSHHVVVIAMRIPDARS